MKSAMKLSNTEYLLRKLAKELRDPAFKNKTYRVLTAPVFLLSLKSKRKIQKFATKHWDKNGAFFHRLYWSADCGAKCDRYL